MKKNNHNTNRNGDKNIENRTSKQKQSNSENQHKHKNNTITDKATKDNNRFITKKVEKQPRSDENDEDDEWDWMPEKTKEEDDEKDDGVVHLEEGDVGFDTGNSVVEVGWEVEGTEVEEEFPWTASS